MKQIGQYVKVKTEKHTNGETRSGKIHKKQMINRKKYFFQKKPHENTQI